MSISNYDDALPTNGIKIKDAENWTAAWREKNPSMTRAFLIPNTDLMSLLVELGVLVDKGSGMYEHNTAAGSISSIRAYLAIGPDETSGDGKLEDKLVLCGAVEVGDIYQDQVANSPHPLKVKLSGDGTFDLTRPCPFMCDKQSPLNS